MTTLTVTPAPATGSHRLTITPTADVTAVTRNDTRGTADVRTMAGVLPWPSASGVLTLDDYEAAHGRSTYTVTTTAGTVTEVADLELPGPWLGTPETPQFYALVPAVHTYTASMETKTTVHEPDGADPIVIVRGASTRKGSLLLEAGTYAAALNLLRLFQRGQTMHLRQREHAGMDMYFVPMAADIQTTLSAGGDSRFDVSVQYLETGRPAGALAGAIGWTWDALAAEYATWDDVFAAYASWGDVRNDRRIS